MKASTSIAVERAIAAALADRLVKTETVAAAQADLDTIRAIHARTPSDALFRALGHVLGLMNPQDPARAALADECALAQRQARAAEPKRSDAASSGSFSRPPVAYGKIEPLPHDIVLDSGTAWHLPPCFGGDWVELGPEEARDAIARIRTAFPSSYGTGTVEGVRAVRAIVMDCYPGFRAVEVLFRFDTRPPISAVYLVSSDLVLWITGASPGLHELNARTSGDGTPCLDISTADKAAQYLRFFCSSVHGEEGPFRIVETADELAAHLQDDTLPESVLAKIGPIRPIRIENEADDAAWRATAVVIYGTDIFESQFKLQRTGMIEMIDDTQIPETVMPLRQAIIQGLRQPSGSR